MRKLEVISITATSSSSSLSTLTRTFFVSVYSHVRCDCISA